MSTISPYSSLNKIDLINKRIFLRVDFNVPMTLDGQIMDDSRILSSLPTIQYILQQSPAQLMICTHLGRPKQGESDESYTLKPIAKHLSSLLNVDVPLVKDWFSGYFKNKVILLENARLYPYKETEWDFSKKVQGLFDIYVNDGFSVSHRKEVTTYCLPKLLACDRSCIGFAFEKELKAIHYAISSGLSPRLAIVGGSKIETKLNLITSLCQTMDAVFIGGKMANELFLQDRSGGRSSLIPDELYQKVILPVDGKLHLNDESFSIMPFQNWIGSNQLPMYDIGPESCLLLQGYIDRSKTVIWNGPLGFFERKPYDESTMRLAHALSQKANEHGAYVLSGGGETTYALKCAHIENFQHISMGGGAFLHLIGHGTLPALEAIQKETLCSREIILISR